MEIKKQMYTWKKSMSCRLVIYFAEQNIRVQRNEAFVVGISWIFSYKKHIMKYEHWAAQVVGHDSSLFQRKELQPIGVTKQEHHASVSISEKKENTNILPIIKWSSYCTVIHLYDHNSYTFVIFDLFSSRSWVFSKDWWKVA